jgi:hypothetical protein
MKNLKYLAVLLVASSYELVASWGSAKFQVRVYNKGTKPARVLTAGRDSDHNNPQIKSSTEVGFKTSVGDAYNVAVPLQPGEIRLIENGQGSRGIFVFFDGQTADNPGVAFNCSVNKAELYVYDNYVAFWNMDKLQPVFPNGLTKNTDGSVKDIDKITPGSTSPKAWNTEDYGQMLTMFDKNLGVSKLKN